MTFAEDALRLEVSSFNVVTFSGGARGPAALLRLRYCIHL